MNVITSFGPKIGKLTLGKFWNLVILVHRLYESCERILSILTIYFQQESEIRITQRGANRDE